MVRVLSDLLQDAHGVPLSHFDPHPQSFTNPNGYYPSILSRSRVQVNQTLVVDEESMIRLWEVRIDDLLKQAERLIQREPPLFTPEERQRFGLVGED